MDVAEIRASQSEGGATGFRRAGASSRSKRSVPTATRCPVPPALPKKEWVDEVNQGFVLYGESGRNDLEVPDYNDVLKYFQYQAPEVVAFPESIRDVPPCPISLSIQRPCVFLGARPPGVANVRWTDIGLRDLRRWFTVTSEPAP